jgi:long-subunit acyl-CoA synthetase (AMP-forming)
MATYMANMHFNYTTIGFFESMDAQTVNYIVNQTELKTICCEKMQL